MLDTFEIVAERSLVRIVYQYHPTYREWEEMMIAIFEDPSFQPGFHFLFDKRLAKEAATNGYAERVAHFYDRHKSKLGRCAIVAGDLLAFGMSRMTANYCIDDNVRAFTSLEDAEAWLFSKVSVSGNCAVTSIA